MVTGDVILVTGGGRGIGRAVCIELSRKGFSVAAVSRTSAELAETVELMNQVKVSDAQAHCYLAADVTQETDVVRAFDEVTERYGHIDALVNGAGYVEPAGILEMTTANWSVTMATNLDGVFFCCREFVKRRKNQGGRIVNIASTAGLSARPGWSAYAAAKAGVINLSMTLSEELRPYGIRVYCVAPGRTATALRLRLAPTEDQSKILQPAAVGQLISLLVDGSGQYIDGQTIVIKKPTP